MCLNNSCGYFCNHRSATKEIPIIRASKLVFLITCSESEKFHSLPQNDAEPIQLQGTQQQVECHHYVEYVVPSRSYLVGVSILQDMENVSIHLIPDRPPQNDPVVGKGNGEQWSTNSSNKEIVIRPRFWRKELGQINRHQRDGGYFRATQVKD